MRAPPDSNNSYIFVLASRKRVNPIITTTKDRVFKLVELLVSFQYGTITDATEHASYSVPQLQYPTLQYTSCTVLG